MAPVVNPFALEPAGDALSRCVALAVTYAAHSADNMVVLQELLYSALVNCVPLSESRIAGLRSDRCQLAIITAFSTKCLSCTGVIDQRTTLPEHRSSTAQRYNQPSSARMQVMFTPHLVLTAGRQSRAIGDCRHEPDARLCVCAASAASGVRPTGRHRPSTWRSG